MHKLVLVAILVALPFAAFAKEAVPAAKDPVLEQRVMALAEDLRCLVCQNQTLADSHADLAIDLKNEIRERMKAGATDRDVIDYLVARYGDFVLYRPPVNPMTMLLWFGPLLILVLGLTVLFRYVARRRRPAAEELAEPDEKRVQALLAEAEARGDR